MNNNNNNNNNNNYYNINYSVQSTKTSKWDMQCTQAFVVALEALGVGAE